MASSTAPAGPRSRRGAIVAALVRDRVAAAASLVLLALVVCALAGKALTEWIVLFDPATVRLPDKLLPPMAKASASLPADVQPILGRYVLGTDQLGRDLFARMLQGSFVSLSIGAVAVSIALVVGITLGAMSAYYGERRLALVKVDTLIMRFTDAMLSFPTFFALLTVVALLPPSIYTIMVVIGLTGWMGTARFVRAEFLRLMEQDFIAAARALGLPDRRIILRHLLPNALAPVLVSATIAVATAILIESSLSFLGFGVQPPFATWGNILADGRLYLFDAPWLFFVPGMAILVVVLAFNLMGEALRDALNPRLLAR